jgi:hypothetical protein
MRSVLLVCLVVLVGCDGAGVVDLAADAGFDAGVHQRTIQHATDAGPVAAVAAPGMDGGVKAQVAAAEARDGSTDALPLTVISGVALGSF